MLHKLSLVFLIACTFWPAWIPAAAAVEPSAIHITLPNHRISPHELAVIVNDADPLSVAIADYYIRARRLPAENLIHVTIPTDRDKLGAKPFKAVKAAIDKATPEHIQAYAITWVKPFRVDCMSITSAITFGFDRAWCSKTRCAPTQRSAYFLYAGTRPFHDLGLRPTMSIAATGFEQARALIDRGVSADNTHPGGTAYLLSTSDKARNVRAVFYAPLSRSMQGWINTEVLNSNSLQQRDDVLFYFTGITGVDHLDTLTFRPGAIADHLTSAGGQLTGKKQMSVLRWLEAGATGSYGTVVEPCNLLGKFPHPGVVMERYGSGRTLIEAYWQSVQQPGEGIFVGEPLAAPYAGHHHSIDNDSIILHTRQLLPGRYRLYYSSMPVGPYRTLPQALEVKPHQKRFTLPLLGAGYYRLEPLRQLAPGAP